MKQQRVRIGIFASGNGSNAQVLIDSFQDSTCVDVVAVFCNRFGAYVCERAALSGIPCVTFDNTQAKDSHFLLEKLSQHQIHLIVLAGYLRLIPKEVVQKFHGKIVNVHPALLPKFGGEGMYGQKVHEAVLAAHEPVTGVTFHIVTPIYDQGPILFQAEVPITYPTTTTEIAEKIQKLEHQYFPKVVRTLAKPIFQQLNVNLDGKTH